MSRLDRFNEIGTSLTTTSTTANRETITALRAEIERLQQAQPTTHLPPDSIERSPYQPRKYFDPDSQARLNAKGMNWRSFVNNRLPLLNLPDLVLNAILKGEIEYTKGQAIAKIDDLARRAEMLEIAIE